MDRHRARPLETLWIEGLAEEAVPPFEAALQQVCATVALFRDEATDTWRVEGVREARWILMDYLDCVVHIFTPEARDFYDLEGLWADAEPLPVTPTPLPS